MWLLPTLNRPEKLEACLNSAINAKTTTPCLILIDQKDYEANAKHYLTLKRPKNWDIKVTKGVKMADKVMEAFNWDWEWVGLLNDDHHFVTEGWDKKLVSKLDGTNFVSPNDRQPDRRAFMLPVTATAWSMPLLKAVGIPIYPEGLKHLFIDNLWLNLGRSTGTWRMTANVIVEHHHVLWGKAQEDDTHRQVYDKRAWDHDEAIFKLFMQHDALKAIEAIKKLQGGAPIQKYNASPSKPVVKSQPGA